MPMRIMLRYHLISDELLNPKKYKILFYAETKKEEEQSLFS